MKNTFPRFKHPSDFFASGVPIYRAQEFPPKNESVVSVDKHGVEKSFFGDDYWDFSAFNFNGFNFARQNISSDNTALVKQALIFSIYSPELFPGKVSSCYLFFNTLVKLAKVCDTHGILLSEVSSTFSAHRDLADAMTGSSFKLRVNYLHRLDNLKEKLGFQIADSRLIGFIVNHGKNIDSVQTAYIPPRIWSYYLKQISQFLEKFIENSESIAKDFDWLSSATEFNLKNFAHDRQYINPFARPTTHSKLRITTSVPIEEFYKRNGILALAERSVGTKELGIKLFSRCLDLVRDCSQMYILIYSLQRKSEASSLRSDCLVKEKDHRLGNIHFLIGETTKLSEDDDARWVVPQNISLAVQAASIVAKMRLRHAPDSVKKECTEKNSLPLFMPSYENWGTYRPSKNGNKAICCKTIIKRSPFLFETEQITPTEADWKIALALTPSLAETPKLGPKQPWYVGAHQFRRTACVNMFTSNMVSDSSLQWQMKHMRREMTYYYGRGHTNLRLNSEVATSIILESYRAIYRNFVDVVSNDSENIVPHNKKPFSESVVALVDENDEKQLTKLIRDGSVDCRVTLLGFCTKAGYCEYGGIETITKCAGGDGSGICSDAVFKRQNSDKLKALKQSNEGALKRVPENSMRFKSLQQEIRAIENYMNVINK